MIESFNKNPFEQNLGELPTPEKYRSALNDAVTEGIITQAYADTIQDKFAGYGIEHLKQIRGREKLLLEMGTDNAYGLTEDRLFELRQRDPNYTVRHLEHLKRRETLIAQLQQRDLLNGEIIALMRNLEDPWYACKQLTELGNREIVDKTLPSLRSAEKPVEKFGLPAEGEPLTTYMIESLKSAGVWRPSLKVRVISRERLEKALASGTDRDGTSLTTIHHGGDDGEELAMKQNDLDASRDLGQTTYVSELDTWSADRKRHGDLVVLVYAPEALKSIQPTENKTGSFSNGFHMFTDRRLIKPSLLAVFS